MRLVRVIVCPPAVYLHRVSSLLLSRVPVSPSGSIPFSPTSSSPTKESGDSVGAVLSVGGQNALDQASGAYTGEVSPGMLADAGATYVILGHSERRTLFGEDDATVAAKTNFVLKQSSVSQRLSGHECRKAIVYRVESLV